MKINVIKSIISFGLSILIGLLCFAIAKEEGSRNWISLAITAVTCFACLGAALGCEYNCGTRNINIKVTAWIGAVVLIIANLIFSCFEYNIFVYITITLMLTLMVVASIYGLYKPKE
jgi:hypothetical protein